MASSRARRLAGLSKVQPTGLPFEIVDGVDAKMWRPEALPVVESARNRVRPGEVGCHMAHLRAMSRIVDYGLEWGCVLEDDFCYESDPDFGLVEIENALPQPFDFVHLQRDWGWNTQLKISERKGAFERTYGTSYGTVGYIIHRNFAQYLLKDHALCSMPIDHLLNELAKGQWRFYRPVKPLIGVQLGLDSDIH
jgi:glycosyl transferase, family 25